MRTPPSNAGLAGSGSHFLAAIGALAASVHTTLHVADPLAIVRALTANFCTFAAGVFVVIRTDKHEMS